MKELETKPTAGEIQPIKEQLNISYVGNMRLKKGMTLFAINLETLEVEPATFRKNLRTTRLELHRQKGYAYVPAINKQNAIKKLLKKAGKC